MSKLHVHVDDENPSLLHLLWDEEWVLAVNKALFSRRLKALERCREKSELIAECRKIERQAALVEAIRLLSRKGYFRHELMDKLISKGFSDEAAEHTVEEMGKKGYIDDQLRSEKIVRMELEKGHGPQYICQMLKHKRVPSDVIAALLPLMKKSEKQSLKSHLTKRSKMSDPHDQKKKIARLLRRGYSFDAIQEALN